LRDPYNLVINFYEQLPLAQNPTVLSFPDVTSDFQRRHICNLFITIFYYLCGPFSYKISCF